MIEDAHLHRCYDIQKYSSIAYANHENEQTLDLGIVAICTT